MVKKYLHFNHHLTYPYLVILIFIFGSFLIASQTFRNDIFVERPLPGGVLHEGIIGTPALVNSILATSNADKDLTELIYSGLVSINEKGEIVPSLAESWTIRQKEFEFTLKDNAIFHDGEKITTEDIAFTIRQIQNPNLNSPLFGIWSDVGIEIIDEARIKFTIPRDYAPFIYNTTVGILPKHIWENVVDEEFFIHNANIRPIGSGPYKVKDISFDINGKPLQYSLSPFNGYANGTPFIQEINITFFRNYQNLINAVKRGEINSTYSIDIKDAENIRTTSRFLVKENLLNTSNVFALFFNISNNIYLQNTNIRKALLLATNSNEIVEETFGKYAKTINGPIPHHEGEEAEESIEEKIKQARAIIEKEGYKQNEESGIYEKSGNKLTIVITTLESKHLVDIAFKIKEQWKNIGVNVEVEKLSEEDFLIQRLRPREFDAVLTGYTIPKTLDIFSFWHSSQINDPGVNISSYVDIDVDHKLENAQRVDIEDRKMIYNEIKEEIVSEVNTIFLYSPLFAYVLPNSIQGTSFKLVEEPSDRFATIHKWYFRKSLVWELFGELENFSENYKK